MSAKFRIRSIDEGDFKGKRVLLRVDINSPVDKATGNIVNDNRIQKSIPTIRDLTERGAKLVIVSHQGVFDVQRLPIEHLIHVLELGHVDGGEASLLGPRPLREIFSGMLLSTAGQ